LFLGSAILLMGLSGTQIYGYLSYGFFPSNHIFLIQSFPSSFFLERTLTAQDRLSGVAIAPDGKTLVSGGEEKIKIWNLATGKLIRCFEGGINSRVTFSPDGNILATQHLTSSRNGKGIPDEYKSSIKLWDVVTGKEIRTLQTEYDEYLSSFAFSPDGKAIASSGVNKVMWKLESKSTHS
jgi:WD40 repeat protein